MKKTPKKTNPWRTPKLEKIGKAMNVAAEAEKYDEAKKLFMDYLNAKFTPAEIFEKDKLNKLIKTDQDRILAEKGLYGELLKKNAPEAFMYWWCECYY